MMKTKSLVAGLTLALAGLILSSQVHAAPVSPYLKGSFDGWGAGLMMNDMGGGHYALTLTNLTPSDVYQFKVDTLNDWTIAYPSQDVWALANASGELTVHYYDFFGAGPGDGWSPNTNRVGYVDPGLHGWSLAGDFNGWTDSAMTDMGGGVYSIDYNIATAGTYGWKFKDATTWDIAIGTDFGSWSGNNSITTTADNTVVTFTLDLPNGRFMAIPEPATIGLISVFGIGLLATRRLLRLN